MFILVFIKQLEEGIKKALVQNTRMGGCINLGKKTLSKDEKAKQCFSLQDADYVYLKFCMSKIALMLHISRHLSFRKEKA